MLWAGTAALENEPPHFSAQNFVRHCSWVTCHTCKEFLFMKMNLLIFQRKILSDIVVGLPAIRVKNFDVKLHNNIAISAKRTKDICSVS